MSSVFGLVHRLWSAWYPPTPAKTDGALRFGILGAANIAPLALITPAKSHPEVIIQAVAARDKKKAVAFAKRHGIPEVKDNYDAILDDPNIDCVYVPLPNGLHYEWALKALEKGKHVLLEKPCVSNSTEAVSLFRSPILSQANAPVLLEAFHYRFQPAWQYFLSLVDQPNVTHAVGKAFLPSFIFTEEDIRFDYDLAGGALMDLGAYPTSALRQVFGAEPEACLEHTVQTARPPRDKADRRTEAKWRFPNGGIGEHRADLRAPLREAGLPSIAVTHRPVEVAPGEGAKALPAGQKLFRTRKLAITNFMVSNLYHSIGIEDEYVVRRADETGEMLRSWTERRTDKAYTWRQVGIDRPGEPYWLSYRHQLEQFVDRVRGRPGSGVWVSGEDSIAQMRMLDMAYEKAGLPLRPTSRFYKPGEAAI